MPIELHGVYYTTEEAAKILGYATTSAVQALVLSGKIPAQRAGRTWLIHEETLSVLDKKEVKPQGTRGVARK